MLRYALHRKRIKSRVAFLLLLAGCGLGTGASEESKAARYYAEFPARTKVKEIVEAIGVEEVLGRDRIFQHFLGEAQKSVMQNNPTLSPGQILLQATNQAKASYILAYFVEFNTESGFNRRAFEEKVNPILFAMHDYDNPSVTHLWSHLNIYEDLPEKNRVLDLCAERFLMSDENGNWSAEKDADFHRTLRLIGFDDLALGGFQKDVPVDTSPQHVATIFAAKLNMLALPLLREPPEGCDDGYPMSSDTRSELSPFDLIDEQIELLVTMLVILNEEQFEAFLAQLMLFSRDGIILPGENVEPTKELREAIRARLPATEPQGAPTLPETLSIEVAKQYFTRMEGHGRGVEVNQFQSEADVELGTLPFHFEGAEPSFYQSLYARFAKHVGSTAGSSPSVDELARLWHQRFLQAAQELHRKLAEVDGGTTP